MHKNKLRQFRQGMKRLLPKKVNVTPVGTNGFCKYGRVRGGRESQSEFVMVAPIKGNQNNNWKIG